MDSCLFFWFDSFTQAPNDKTLTRRPVRPRYRYSIRSFVVFESFAMISVEYLKQEQHKTGCCFYALSFLCCTRVKYTLVFLSVFLFSFCISNPSIRRKAIKKKKSNLSKYSFSNIDYITLYRLNSKE